MKNNKFWLIIAGASGFIAVAMGAFGAHSFNDQLSTNGLLETYRTGALYILCIQ